MFSNIRIVRSIIFALLAVLFISCNITEPEEFYSPTAGFVRVIIRSDNSDTNINILGVDYNISDQDSLDLLVFQGKVFNADSNYAILFHNIKSWRQEEFVYNILDWDSENGYTEFKIFESHVPPGAYDLITLGLIASIIEIGPYRIPISLPPDTEGVLELPTSFTVDEKNVTQITLSLKPFQSMSRYRDDYVFDRQIEIESIEYFGQDEYEKVIADSDSLNI
ncbi:MAG: hypothetical protein CMG67_02955 [Candidatus Marinimicrobia bacterium]|nr:hypothetical protein [Candidatus Neomarinimicrobiota bacterium]|tara:strand:+ start:29363 stop:30028 length:666 start_codon:yes stop_codon:yes gene_type:complete